MVFAGLSDNHEYIVGLDDMTPIEFLTKYPNAKRATGLNLDNEEEHFFLVAVADCYDPPVAIIRAAGPASAEETFVDELTWAHVRVEDLDDYVDGGTLGKDPSVIEYADHLHWNSDGVPYDSEGIVMYEVRPLRIEF